ncbi:MAG: hypothetical protein ACC742_03760 [Thermoanaerobaculales bacterium]
MNRHLEDRSITAAVAGLELGTRALEHLASCLSCRQQVRSMREVIEECHRITAAEAPDWDRQRLEILRALPAPITRPERRSLWMRPLLAAAAVILVVVGIGVLRWPFSQHGGRTGSDLPVEQILAEANAALADDTIPGFESIDFGVDDLESIVNNGAS